MYKTYFKEKANKVKRNQMISAINGINMLLLLKGKFYFSGQTGKEANERIALRGKLTRTLSREKKNDVHSCCNVPSISSTALKYLTDEFSTPE